MGVAAVAGEGGKKGTESNDGERRGRKKAWKAVVVCLLFMQMGCMPLLPHRSYSTALGSRTSVPVHVCLNKYRMK